MKATVKKVKLTDYQVRKAWRVKLNLKRGVDHNHTPARYLRDAGVLNRAMAIFKIDGSHAKWGR